MNLILFSRSSSAARIINIAVPQVAACGILLFAIITSAFGLGFWLAPSTDAVQPVAEVDELRQELAGQTQVLADIRGAAQEQIDALALRLGELNASAIRLNALGRRLTSMADLDEGEFDFDTSPALGGPEDPAVARATDQVQDIFGGIDTMDRALHGQEQQLIVLESLLLNRKLHDRVYPQGMPVRSGWISSYFGRRTDPFTGKSASHRGVDFAGKAGTEVVAVAAGVVIWSGPRSGYGNMIEINHGNGYITRYAHNKQNLVVTGDQIQQAQTIALMGSSGRATGPNLHFEVRHRGRPVDPVKHIRETT